MQPVSLKKDGSLTKIFRPAIYLDTNFLRHYYNAEGAEFYVDENGNDVDPPWEKDWPLGRPNREELRAEILQGLIKTKDHTKEFGIIRHIAINCLSKASLILTPISLLELYKIHAEIMFKETCAEAVGVKSIQRMGDKPVGKILSKLYEKASADTDTGPYQALIQACHFNTSFAGAHGLRGIFYVSEHTLKLSMGDVEKFLWLLSFLQLEATDILHIHSAKKLGCEYFATFDNGIKDNKKIIEKAAGFKILSKPMELINILNKNKKK